MGSSTVGYNKAVKDLYTSYLPLCGCQAWKQILQKQMMQLIQTQGNLIRKTPDEGWNLEMMIKFCSLYFAWWLSDYMSNCVVRPSVSTSTTSRKSFWNPCTKRKRCKRWCRKQPGYPGSTTLKHPLPWSTAREKNTSNHVSKGLFAAENSSGHGNCEPGKGISYAKAMYSSPEIRSTAQEISWEMLITILNESLACFARMINSI